MDKIRVGWQRYDISSVKARGGCKIVNNEQWRDCQTEKKQQHCFYSQKRKHFSCQWRKEVFGRAVAPAIPVSCLTDSTNRNDTTNVANIPKNYTSILIMICTRSRSSVYWPRIGVRTIHFLRIIDPFNISSDHFLCLRPWPLCTRRWVHPNKSWTLKQFERGFNDKYILFLLIVFTLQSMVYQNRNFWCRFVQSKT